MRGLTLMCLLLMTMGCKNRLEAQWTNPELVVRDSLSPDLWMSASLNSPRLAVTDSAIHVALISVRSNLILDPLEVLLTTRRNGRWSELTNISNTPTFSFNPTMGVDQSGALHIIWHEQLWKRRPADTLAIREATDIFYANNKNGAWSRPIRLFGIDSNRARAGVIDRLVNINDAVMDENGVFHLTFDARIDRTDTNRAMFGVQYMRYENGRWTAPVLVYEDGGDPHICVAPDGTIYVSFVGFVPSMPSGFTSPLVSKSTDNGRTWSTPTVVHRAGRQPVGRVSVYADATGKVHVIFLKSYTEMQAFGSNGLGIWHCISNDGGRTWSAPDTVSKALGSAPLLFNVLRGTIDKAGQLHLLALAQKEIIELTPITYFTWRNGRWQQPVQLNAQCFGELRVFDIVADSKGKLHVVWVEKGREPRGIYYMTSNIATSSAPEVVLGKPQSFQLFQNYPNPFNPTTVISYQLPVPSAVLLKVYDLMGREVATLVNQWQAAGRYDVPFNAANLSSGVYFYRLSAGTFSETKKMMLVK